MHFLMLAEWQHVVDSGGGRLVGVSLSNGKASAHGFSCIVYPVELCIQFWLCLNVT